jgi:hypothetical protein
MMFPKNPVLLLEILDNVLLIAAHPSRQRHHQELKWKCIHGYNGNRPVKVLVPRQQERRFTTDGNETDYVRLTYGTLRGSAAA